MAVLGGGHGHGGRDGTDSRPASSCSSVLPGSIYNQINLVRFRATGSDTLGRLGVHGWHWIMPVTAGIHSTRRTEEDRKPSQNRDERSHSPRAHIYFWVRGHPLTQRLTALVGFLSIQDPTVGGPSPWFWLPPPSPNHPSLRSRWCAICTPTFFFFFFFFLLFCFFAVHFYILFLLFPAFPFFPFFCLTVL